MKENKEQVLTSLQDIQDELANDVFCMDESQLRASMADMGLDFDKSAAEGERLIAQLARAHRRESMKRKAAAKKQSDQQRRALVSPARLQQGIADMVRRIRMGEPGLQAAFRDRRPDQMSEDELVSIAEDLFWVEQLNMEQGDGKQ